MLIILSVSFIAKSSDEEQQFCELNKLSQQLSTELSLNEFTQSKTIKVLSRPLLSTGNLLLIKDKGVIWQTLSPIKGTTVITSSDFKQLDQNDMPSSFNNAMNGQASKTLSNIFLGLLSGDLERLQQHFTISGNCKQNDWQLTFMAADKQVSEFLQKIILTGQSNKILKVELFEANQDYSEIILQPKNDVTSIKKLEAYFES